MKMLNHLVRLDIIPNTFALCYAEDPWMHSDNSRTHRAPTHTVAPALYPLSQEQRGLIEESQTANRGPVITTCSLIVLEPPARVLYSKFSSGFHVNPQGYRRAV